MHILMALFRGLKKADLTKKGHFLVKSAFFQGRKSPIVDHFTFGANFGPELVQITLMYIHLSTCTY